MTVTSPSGTEEIGAITAILDEYMYVSAIGRFAIAIRIADAAIGPYDFQGFIRYDEALPESGREQRRVLLDRFEIMMGRLADAGWQPASYPRLVFSGRVKPFIQTLDGQLVLPAVQQTESLEVDLELDRPR